MFLFSVRENMVGGTDKEEKVGNTPKLREEKENCWWVVS